MVPETRYAKSGTINIAYQVFGSGAEDLVLVPGWVSNVDTFWEEPVIVRFFESLATTFRLILFDKRGTGLSDRMSGMPTLEDRMDDVRAVMDAAGPEKATLFGYSEGGPMCALFAATYPQRTRALVLAGSYACRWTAPGYEGGMSEEEVAALVETVETRWGTPMDIDHRIPSLAGNPRFRSWWAKFLRAGASPGSALELLRLNLEIDVRPILSAIQVPALFLHATRDQTVNIKAGRYFARHVAGARFVELDADDHVPFGDCADRVTEEIRQFVTGRRESTVEDRVLSTIMFTDIVDSTRVAGEMGDAAWRDLLGAHHEAVRGELAAYRGNEVKTTGDGFHATFDGPARAIRCGRAIRHSVRALGLGIRVGIHTGECVFRGQELEGLAVHIAARIGALAEEGQVLVSRTVRDLVAGSGIEFDDLGEHRLKGIDGRWAVCAVR